MEGVRRRRGGGNASQQHQRQLQHEDVEDDNGKGHMMDGDAFWSAGMSRGGRKGRGEEEEEDRVEFPLIARPVPMYAYYGTVLWAASATLKWFYDWLPSWQSFSALLWAAPQQPFVITAAMQQKVDDFKGKIAIAYSDDDPLHEATLRQYWALCFPGEEYQRKSKRWTDAGFQSDDPGRDFRGAGICGLQHLCYFAKERPVDFLRCRESGYPFSIAGLNVSMMLYQLMGWGFKKRDPLPELFRLVFTQEGDTAFFDLYCTALNFLDDEWRKKNAQYMDFPIVLASTEARLKAYILAQAHALNK